MRVGTGFCGKIRAVEYANAPALLVTAEGVTPRTEVVMCNDSTPATTESTSESIGSRWVASMVTSDGDVLGVWFDADTGTIELQHVNRDLLEGHHPTTIPVCDLVDLMDLLEELRERFQRLEVI